MADHVKIRIYCGNTSEQSKNLLNGFLCRERNTSLKTSISCPRLTHNIEYDSAKNKNKNKNVIFVSTINPAASSQQYFGVIG